VQLCNRHREQNGFLDQLAGEERPRGAAFSPGRRATPPRLHEEVHLVEGAVRPRLRRRLGFRRHPRAQNRPRRRAPRQLGGIHVEDHDGGAGQHRQADQTERRHHREQTPGYAQRTLRREEEGEEGVPRGARQDPAAIHTCESYFWRALILETVSMS
jgi:hypothetical protein